jgi:succinate dehydrogenase / fumarate reductase membrane anchor subunit
MQFLTDRKRAIGRGSSRTGTRAHWNMTLSSYGLLILVPLFVLTFGPILGASYENVYAYYTRPFPAIVAGLTLTVGLLHFRNGAQTMIEDYVQGHVRQIAIIVTTCISYAAIGAGLFALARIAL